MDMMKKIEKAVATKGPCYVQVHAPCATGWGFESDQTMTIGKLAVDTGLWVNYEMVNGEVTRAKKVVRKPVEEYLILQKRFRHLFRPARQDEEIAKIQAFADRNAERFDLDIKKK
jgi:pyruvate ferredoxin oxidoreductase beta subunit